jgi:hypothetical protein
MTEKPMRANKQRAGKAELREWIRAAEAIRPTCLNPADFDALIRHQKLRLGDEIMAKNLLRDSWADLDQADLRLLLQEQIGRPGQYEGDENVIHLPLAREQCRVSLTYKGAKIVAIEPGLAFDRQEWDRICAEIEGPIMKGPLRVGRDISFNTKGVEGWWRGERSGVQILPAPESAPRANEGADNPFILEFPTVFRDPLSEGFRHFVASMPAPVASGWSGRRVGTCTHWKAPPFHGAHPLRKFGSEFSMTGT